MAICNARCGCRRKAALDSELGSLGVHQAEKRLEDAEHEAARNPAEGLVYLAEGGRRRRPVGN